MQHFCLLSLGSSSKTLLSIYSTHSHKCICIQQNSVHINNEKASPSLHKGKQLTWSPTSQFCTLKVGHEFIRELYSGVYLQHFCLFLSRERRRIMRSLRAGFCRIKMLSHSPAGCCQVACASHWPTTATHPLSIKPWQVSHTVSVTLFYEYYLNALSVLYSLSTSSQYALKSLYLYSLNALTLVPEVFYPLILLIVFQMIFKIILSLELKQPSLRFEKEGIILCFFWETELQL